MGRVLRTIREYCNYDLDRAETEIGISKYSIEKIESGEKEIDLQTAINYSVAFDIPLDGIHFFRKPTETPCWRDRIRIPVANAIVKILEKISD